MREQTIKLLSVLMACSCLPCIALAGDANWVTSGNGPANDASAPGETVLGRDTVAGLVLKWSLATTGEVAGTPTVHGDAVYAADSGGSLWRVNAATGKPVWHVMMPALTGVSGSNSRNSPAIGPDRIIVGDQAAGRLYAFSKADGTLLWNTLLDRAPGAIVTSSPVIVGGSVIVGLSSNQEELAAKVKGFVPSFRGSIVSLSLADGHVQWQTYAVPDGFTGGAVWGSNIAVDVGRQMVFASTGDNYSVPPSVSSCQQGVANPTALNACLPAADHIDSVLALDLGSGAVKWAQRTQALDTWTVSCLQSGHPPATPCPEPHGLDYDFGSAPNLFTASSSGVKRDLVGAGEKSGAYWAFDRDSGAVVWGTQVNPGGTRGGIQWGSAVSGGRIFIAASNSGYVFTGLLGQATETEGGYWSALDASTGQILWQTPTSARQPKPATSSSRTGQVPPGALARAEGAVSAANGVMYAADAAGDFHALDAATGKELWTFAARGAAVDAPSISNGMLFWGDGYGDIGRTAMRIYAFGLK